MQTGSVQHNTGFDQLFVKRHHFRQQFFAGHFTRFRILRRLDGNHDFHFEFSFALYSL